MGAQFQPRISWPKNSVLLPAGRFKVKVPAGVHTTDVRSPNFVDASQMGRLTRDDETQPSGPLHLTAGLVTADLKVTFADFAAQWRRCPMPGSKEAGCGPCQFQFLGGQVFLDLILGVYILKTGEPDPKDDLSVKIFALLYGHELLHVFDEIDIIKNWLGPQLNSDSTVLSYLIQAQPYTYGTSRQLTAEVEREFQSFICDRIQTAIFNLWGTESNQRQRLRDSPAQYKLVQDQVDDLRAAQINRPHR